MWEDKCYELLKAMCMRDSTEILEYTEKIREKFGNQSCGLCR